MSTNSKLQSAIHLALGLSAGALAVTVVPSVFAQGMADQDDEIEATEEVIVTGSRIRRADINSASPVTVLTRDDIIATGVVDIGDLIQRMPAMSGSPIGTTTNNGGNGSVQIDLRGMGPERTVLLVNGHRTVDGGDFQAIPATMIDHVEILKDGASAIYGADAVAGVVNIITRRNFEGVEVGVQTADWFDARGEQQSYSLISGTEFNGGNFVFGAEFVDQQQALQSDTPWDFFQDSFYIYPLGCQNQVTAPYDGTPSGGCYPVGSSRIPQSRLQFTDQGRFLIGTPATQPYQVGLMIPHDGRTYNYAPVNFIQTPFKRTNIFAEAHFDLTDNVRFNIEVRGNFRESEQKLAPMPFNSPTDPAFAGVFEGKAFNGISQDNFYLRRAVDLYNATNGTSLRYEPVRDARRRMIETTRRFTQQITQYQFVGGLEGSFNDMDWEVFYNQGYRSRIDNDFGQFAGNRLSQALGPSADLNGDGIPECYDDITDPSTLIPGCVSFNFFGGGEVAADGTPTVTTVTQDMIDFVAIDLSDSITSQQSIGGASLTGSNFNLPGGEIGWAIGYSYWKQELDVNLDSNKTLDNVTGNTGANTQGSLTNNAVYVEALVPVFDNGTQSLTLKGGFRYDRWDAFKNDTTYQVGLELQVLEAVKLRGTYGTTFRTPTISNLFGGQVDNFPTFTDPCAAEPLPPGCDQLAPQFDSQVLARVGGNPNLQPETGDTLTAGLVFTPNFGNHDVSLTFDYWEIDLKDGISSLGVNFILDDCYVNQNAASCALITRRPGDYTIDNIIDGSLNVARQGAKGYDTEFRWGYDTSVGRLQASVLWAHLLERTKTPFAGAAKEELAGRHTDPTAQDGGSHAKDKVSYSLSWMWHDLTIGYLGEYISGQNSETVFTGETYRISSQWYHDIVATYDFTAFGSTTTIAAGVTNLTDEAPPFIDNGFNAKTDPSTYRLFGIGYYVRLGWKF